MRANSSIKFPMAMTCSRDTWSEYSTDDSTIPHSGTVLKYIRGGFSLQDGQLDFEMPNLKMPNKSTDCREDTTLPPPKLSVVFSRGNRTGSTDTEHDKCRYTCTIN